MVVEGLQSGLYSTCELMGLVYGLPERYIFDTFTPDGCSLSLLYIVCILIVPIDDTKISLFWSYNFVHQ